MVNTINSRKNFYSSILLQITLNLSQQEGLPNSKLTKKFSDFCIQIEETFRMHKECRASVKTKKAHETEVLMLL